jgi:hypothetical protein
LYFRIFFGHIKGDAAAKESEEHVIQRASV